MTGKYTKFLQSVDRSIHHAHIYGARHPLAHRSISDTYNHIMKLLTDNCELSMSFADWKILVNSQPQDSGDEIAILFHKLKLNNIVFYQEIKFEELVTLFSALNLENGMIAGEDFSNKGIGHINVNKAHSKKTDEDLDVKQWLDDFVSNVTHELITPVASVKQSLSNILNLTNGLTLDQQKMLGVALRNTERLSRLINNILDFSMAGSGSIQIRQEIVDCNLLLEDVVSTMKCLADVKRIKLCLGLPNVIPKLFVDRDRIIQVFINLINNAIKFTNEGGRIAVSVCGVRKLGERNLLEISVTDTGIGIEKKEAERIFERFVRVGKDSAADMGGTGLGLSIAASILELHKGYIHVGSEIGKGSVFTVGLPILEDVRCEM